jgi:hypothetical protein
MSPQESFQTANDDARYASQGAKSVGFASIINVTIFSQISAVARSGP